MQHKIINKWHVIIPLFYASSVAFPSVGRSKTIWVLLSISNWQNNFRKKTNMRRRQVITKRLGIKNQRNWSGFLKRLKTFCKPVNTAKLPNRLALWKTIKCFRNPVFNMPLRCNKVGNMMKLFQSFYCTWTPTKPKIERRWKTASRSMSTVAQWRFVNRIRR